MPQRPLRRSTPPAWRRQPGAAPGRRSWTCSSISGRRCSSSWPRLCDGYGPPWTWPGWRWLYWAAGGRWSGRRRPRRAVPIARRGLDAAGQADRADGVRRSCWV